MRSWIGSALVISALSGCLSGLNAGLDEATIPVPLDIAEYALTRLEQSHDHHVEHAEHAGSIGFAQDVFAPFRRGPYPDKETYFELAVQGHYAYMSFNPWYDSEKAKVGAEAGFVIYDIADPAAPKEVGRWLGQALGDIEISDDGNWAFVPTQRNGYPYLYAINPLAAPTGQFPRGTYIVDLHDKTRPTTVGFAPLPPNGPHTVTYVRMPDGRELLLQSTYDILFTTYPTNYGQVLASQKVVISEIVTVGPAKELRPLSIFQLLVPDDYGGAPDKWNKQHFPHDATVHVDPATKQVIMDVAYWDVGLVTVDITDPAKPTELARFADTGPSKYTKTHLVRVFPGTINGRVVGVLEPEIPTGADAGQYTFVDLTNPKFPKRLGHWGLPGDHIVDKPFVFSPHNFDLACGGRGQSLGGAIDYGTPCEDPTVVLGYFHGGLWTLDASDPTSPHPTGFFFPLVERNNIDPGMPWTGFTTAVAYDGLVLAPETWTGLHILTPLS